MASSLISIASSGLKAATTLLNTTSNNITNAYTDGYSRQTVSLTASAGTSTSYGETGTGVTVTGVTREYDELAETQLRTATANYEQTSAYSEQISQIDSLLASDDTSIDTLLDSFFSALSSLSSDASDTSARQSVLSSAQSLVTQLQEVDDYLTSMDDSINQSVSSTVDSINSYTEQIAELNDQITKLGTSSSSANSLLDQRDQLISELNDLVGVTVSTQSGSSAVTVSLSNGLTLVQGSTSYQLQAVTSSEDPSETTIAYVNSNGTLTSISEDSIEGGSLAGLFEARDDIDSARNQLGLIALELASNMNQLQSEGYDLDGESGTDFFSYDDPEVISNSKNTGDASLTAVYSDTSEAAASDYTLTYDGSSWKATKESDGSSVAVTDNGDGTFTFDGLTVTVSGTAESGDKFSVQSVSNVISSLSVAISDGAQIAASSSSDSSESSNNENLAKMLELQTADLVNGKSTLTEAYAALISDVGTKADAAENLATSQSTIVDSLTELAESTSGVNLDEEYVNLTTYQQYYTACAQVLSTASTIFDTLLSAIDG